MRKLHLLTLLLYNTVVVYAMYYQFYPRISFLVASYSFLPSFLVLLLLLFIILTTLLFYLVVVVRDKFILYVVVLVWYNKIV